MPKKNKEPFFKINGRSVGLSFPTYFIADIAANHNGSLSKAKDLIFLAKKAGADAAKFQHFRANKIVSAYGFHKMKKMRSHQSKWKKSVYQVYQEASVPWEWTGELVDCCKKVGIDFFSAPYDFEAIEMLDQYMPAYKIGSGDLNWSEALTRIAKKKKPVFLATGASTLQEVEKAVSVLFCYTKKVCLMQCNTNYTGNPENFKYIQLNVLKAYAKKFPGAVLGLSDHTPGHVTVLGAVALGARAIEKHFTNDRSQEGPDHPFSMDPSGWREMVDRTRELELALGTEMKTVEDNEVETVFIQRRSLRAARDLESGQVIRPEDVDILRPAKKGALAPDDLSWVLGKKVLKFLPKGEVFTKKGVRR